MNKREYNGLRSHQVPFPQGPVPAIGQGLDRASQVQRAIAQEMQILMHEIYVRAASAATGGQGSAPEYYRRLAEQAQLAARSYFEGLGVIQVETPAEQPAAPAE